METVCKACGKDVTGDVKERRPLSGRQYNALFTLATASSLSSPAILVHSFLAKSPSYVCKPCYSVLTKYGSIAKEVETIQNCLKDVLGETQSTETVSVSDMVS